jgi:MFS family permease
MKCGWIIVGVLAVTVTVSYGVLMYAFPVVLGPMQAELGWSQPMFTGAYSLGALAGGLAAVPVGRWLDRHGSRSLMTTTATAASLLVAAWAHVRSPVAYYLIWIGLGVCSAGLSYEPAFTTITQWFRTGRGRALTIVTVAGGLASSIFVPLTAGLVEQFGWRTAVLSLAGLLAAFTIVPHATVLRRPPADPGPRLDACLAAGPVIGTASRTSVSTRHLFAVKSLRWLTAAFFLSTFANMAFAVHLIPLLLARGHPIAFASLALGSIGVMKLLGRLLIMPVARWLTVPTATIVAFSLQAAGLVLLILANSTLAVSVCVLLFGVGDGASTPARAELVAELYGSSRYGTISGVMALFLAVARAAGPVGVSLVFAATAGYDVPLLLMTVLLVSACRALRSARPNGPQGLSSSVGCVLLSRRPSTCSRTCRIHPSRSTL